MIVEEYKIGNTTIKIDDQYFSNITEEEIQVILKKIQDVIFKIVNNHAKC